jgi:hypothetical protein
MVTSVPDLFILRSRQPAVKALAVRSHSVRTLKRSLPVRLFVGFSDDRRLDVVV